VKNKRTGKNGLEFLIGWHDYADSKYDTWEPITNSRIQRTRLLNSTTSGKKITRSKRQRHFNQVIDKRNASHKKNAKTVRDRNTVADITEAGADGDDDNEEGKSEEGGSEHEDEDGEGERGQRTVTHAIA